MRQFYLQNESGNRLDLMGDTGMYLFDPEGLGIEYSDTFYTVEKGFYKRTKEEQTQGSISGLLIFIDKPYEHYQEFLNFCERASTLYFVYSPLETEYYCEVTLGSIEKSELTDGDSLQCQVKFTPHTMWYSLVPITLNFNESGARSRYPGRYKSGNRYGSGVDGFNYIETHGHARAAVRVEVKGASTNPHIVLRGVVSGKVYGECVISGSFTAKETIVLSTKYQDSYIQRIKADGSVEDLINSVDITKDAFFRVPFEERCVLSVSGGSALKLSGEVYDYYRSV